MRSRLATCLTAVLFAVPLCACSGAPCEKAAPPLTLANEPLGEPCRTTADCASGLTCVDAHGTDAVPANATGSLTCTQDCSVLACPNGTTCAAVRPNAGTSVVHVCLPTCTRDEDCGGSVRLSRCELADAGSPLCRPVRCYAATDCARATDGGTWICEGARAQCASGYSREFDVAASQGWCRAAP